jgi:hypothetical protein
VCSGEQHRDGQTLTDESAGYLLTQKEGRYGTPERPLSKLGAIAYGRYWQLSVYKVLYDTPPTQELRMEDICERTRMTLEDVFNTLRTHGLISLDSVSTPHSHYKVSTPSTSRVGGIARKNLSNKNGSTPKPYNNSTQISNLSVYDLTSVPNHYTITWNRHSIKEYLDKVESKGLAKLHPEKLRWSPYLVARVRKNDPGLLEAGLLEVEVDDHPKPSMSSHTPLDPVERPSVLRSTSGVKTPKRKSTANTSGNGGRTVTRNASPTPSTYDEGFEEPIHDDDEFRDDESNDLNVGKSSRQRSSNASRVSLRGGKTIGAGNDSDDGPWSEVPNRARRTRSGRVVGSSLGVDSDSEWEGEGAQIHTRSRSQNTKSSKRAASSSLSTSLPDIREDDDTFKQTGDESLESPYDRKIISPKKRQQQRIITSPSESEREEEDNTTGQVLVESDIREDGPGNTHPFDEDGILGSHITPDHHGHHNGLTSDDQLPETPHVIVTEDHTQAGPSEGLITQQSSHTKLNGWLHEKPNAIYDPLIQEMNVVQLANSIDMKLFATSPAPLLSAEKPEQMPRDTSEDAVMKAVGVGWPGLEVEDDMDMCDEDAEGEDDLTYMV